MENKYVEILECNQVLREHIKDFIEIFVKYYGEEERTYIEDKFNSALFVGYLTEDETKTILREIEEKESDKLYDELISRTTLSVTKDMLFGKSIGNKNYSLDFKANHPIYKFKLYYEECILGEEGRKEKYYLESYQGLRNRNINLTFEEYMDMTKTRKNTRKI